VLPKRMLLSIRRHSVSGRLLVAFVFAIGTLVAQDPTSYMSPNVLRVGEKLSCRCGGCRNTVGNCPMLHCEYSDPMRRRIASMQAQGRSDSDIIDTVVREQGVVALSTPPNEGWGLFTWVMPGIAALIGFFIYSAYVKRNRKTPEPVSAADEAVLRRFQDQIDDELSEEHEFPKEHPGKEK
jgi:cytochrome c-type biogenesis protein CcmH/NrfF